jgi:hypothetical protein
MSEPDRKLDQHKEIAARLRAAILGEDPGFIDALYGLEGLESPEMRELVEVTKQDSARFIEQLREQFAVRSCEVVSQGLHEGTFVVLLRLNGDTLVEAFVDELYERDGRIHAMDVIQFRLVEPAAP